MQPNKLIVNIEFRARSLCERFYAVFALLFLGLAIAIMGKGGATFKDGEDVFITIDKPVRKKRI